MRVGAAEWQVVAVVASWLSEEHPFRAHHGHRLRLRALRWPPRTVIDLREPAERGRGPHPLQSPGTEVVHLPLAGALAPEQHVRLRDAQITSPPSAHGSPGGDTPTTSL